MTMLPDIDQTDYDEYERQRLQQQFEQQNQQFALQQSFDQQNAQLQAIATPPPAPPSSDSLTNPTGTRFLAPATPDEPPEVTQARQQYADQGQATLPPEPAPPPPAAPAPAPEPQPAPSSSPSPSASSNDSWFGQVLGQVAAAGGNVQQFASSFDPGAGLGSALGAAHAAGANVQQFASTLQAPTPTAPEISAVAGQGAPGGVRPSGAPTSGVPGWLNDLIQRNAPGELASDPDFIRTVAAGAKAESGWNINAVQQGGGGRGLFQFDLGGMGAGIPEAQLLGSEGAEMQASRIIPLYAKAYQSAPQGLTGAEKASWVAAQAERPYQFDNPQSAARRNYASAYSDISGPPGTAPQDLLARTGAWAQQAAAQPASQVSQFGQPQLSNDEAYAACGPAAAVRFASMYGRNPTLREATDLAATVGWTSAQGMAGLGSEKALMDKMGVATKAVGPDVQAMAREAQTGNPVTISTQNHYFFADGYDPQSGAFHVGQSGLDLKGGSEWMTPDQMQALQGRIQGALFADNPQVPTTSTADQPSVLDRLGQAKDTVTGAVSSLLGQDTSQPTVNPVTGRLESLGDLVPSGVNQVLQGVGGRVSAVTPSSYEEFTKQIETPKEGDILSRVPGGEQLGTFASGLGARSKVLADIGTELSPFTAAARVHAGEEQLAWSDPAYQALMQQAGIDRDMPPGQQAMRMVNMPTDWQDQANAIMRGIRAQGPAASSAAAWQPDSKREELENAYNLLGGAAAFGLAPEGLASGGLRFAASLAADPSGAPLAVAGALPDLLRAEQRAAPAAGEALGIVQRTGRDVREGLLGPGEAGTMFPRAQLPNSQVWENALSEGARFDDSEGHMGYHAPALESARITPETQGLAPQDRIRQVISDLNFNERFPSDLTDPEANQFASDLQQLGRGMAQGDWTPEQTAISAILTKLSQGRPQRPVTALFENLGDEWVARHLPSLQTQGAVPGGKAASYGYVIRPEVIASHLAGDTADPEMMQFLTAIGRDALDELPAGSDPALASFGTRAERDAVIERGAQHLFDLFSAAGHGGAKGDDVLINGADIVRTSKKTGVTTVSPAAKSGRQAWADTVPELHQKLLDWAQQSGDYAGLGELERKNKLLEDIQNANVAGIGIDKSTFVPNMGFAPDYATLDLRMRRQGFGLSPNAVLTRAERNLLEQKIVNAFPEADSAYVAQWLPWAYMTDEKTDYRSIPRIYNAVGDFMKNAQDVARQEGRPLGEVVGRLAEQTPKVPLEYPYATAEGLGGPSDIITRIGMAPKVLKNLPPGTTGDDIAKAAPELNSFAEQAGVQFVEKPSVGVGLGFDPDGNPVREGDGNLIVKGTEAANRWFGASLMAANPDEASVFLAHTGPSITAETAGDSLGTIRLGAGAQDTRVLHDAMSQFSPDGWHTSVTTRGPGRPVRQEQPGWIGAVSRNVPRRGPSEQATSDLVIGGVGVDHQTFGQRLEEFRNLLESHGFRVESHDSVPARIEFLQQGDIPGVIYGGPRGARTAAGGGLEEAAGEVGRGGQGERSIAGLPPSARTGGAGADMDQLRREAERAVADARVSGGGLPGALGAISRGAAPLRTEIGRQAAYGAVGGGYAASQQEGATPQDILKGALLGAGAGALRGGLPNVNTGRLLNMVARESNAFDGDGRLLGRPTEVERQLWTPDRERVPSDLSQLVSPAGNLLSTVAGGEARVRGAKPAWNDIAGISRTLAGSEPWTLNPPSEEARKAMPNLLHMANGSPEIQATLQRVAEDNPDLIRKYTQGVITHDQLVKDTANKLGMTADDFLKTRVGQAFNPQELLALRGTIEHKHDELAQMTAEIQAKGGAKYLNPEERLGAVRKMLEAAQLQAIGRGAVATAGRALNQQKINVDRGIAAMLTRGNELRSARQALTAARAKQAWANSKLGTPLEEAGGSIGEAAAQRARDRAAIRSARAEPLTGEAMHAGGAQDDWLKALQDDLKATNNYDAKTWDQTMKDLDAQAAKKFPRDASAEGQREWLAAQARVAQQDANRENQRAIAAWNRQLAEGDTRRNMATKILERVGGENITNDMIDNLVKVMQSDDKMAAAKYLQSLQKVSWWDRLSTMRYASMLSSTATHTAQALSNTGQLGMALATHPGAVAFDIAASKLGGGERTRYMSELPAMLRGIIGQAPSELEDSPYMVRGAAGGLRQGAADAAEIMRSGLNPSNISRNWEQVAQPGFGFEQTALGKAIGPRWSGAANFLAEGPLRTLEAGDSLIRGAARGAFAHGLAERQAIREGYQGAAKRARVDEIVRNFDEFPELFAQADDAAKRVVLQEQRPGGLASGLMSARRGPEGLAMSLVMPFVRTPWNVAAQGAGLTPLGYLGALKAAANGERGEAVDRAARATLGTGILGAASMLGANGYLTGGTPQDPSEKSSLEPNWQPYALRIPHSDGSATFIKYSNLGPVGVPLAAGAILGDAYKQAQSRGQQGLPLDPGQTAFRMTAGMGRYMVDQTMLQGLSNLIDAVTDPERKAQNFAEGLTTQFAPYAALGRQLDRTLGTGPRDTREGYQGLLDAVMASYPGLSGNVPPRLDPLGREIRATQTGIGSLVSPATYTQSPYDPLTEAMRNADVGVGATPKAWRNFAMNEQEQRQFQQQSGYYIDQMLRDVVNDPAFQRAPIAERQIILQRVIAAARNAGGADIVSQLSDEQLMQRYQQEQQRTAAVPR